MRTLQFQETDRVPVYDIFQNDAIIEHYAAEILNGKRYSVEDGLRVKGFAIGRILDMTRMPEGPCEPGEFVNEDRLRIQQERWTSWIVERPFKDIPQMLDWVQWEIQKT